MILIINLLLTFFDELFNLLWQTILEMSFQLDLQFLAKQLFNLDVKLVLSFTTSLSKLELLLFLLLLKLSIDSFNFLQSLNEVLHLDSFPRLGRAR